MAKANDTAIAIAGWNAGHRDYADLIAYVRTEIARIEEKSPADIGVQARARVAAANVINAKTVEKIGGITGTIGGTIAEAPGTVAKVPGVRQVVSLGEFLASLSDWHTWLRMAEVIGGAIAIVIGVRIMAQQSGATRLAGRIRG